MATKDSNSKQIQFPKDMSKAQLDIYLRELFPNVSEEVGDSAEAGYPWVLLVKSKNSLTVSSKTTFTGEDILATRTPASRPRDVQSVYIGMRSPFMHKVTP